MSPMRIVTTLAGVPSLGPENIDGIGGIGNHKSGAAARFYYPTGMAYSAKDQCLYVGCYQLIRRVDLSSPHSPTSVTSLQIYRSHPSFSSSSSSTASAVLTNDPFA